MPTDLAMVDITMPGMTGWQVSERLRGIAGLEGLRIVIVSANAHEYSPGGGGALHDAFLIKPIEMQRLLECLAQQLGLQWIHEHALAAGAEASTETTALPGHARHHVDDLYQLGLIGHVRGIQAKLREMENDPGSRPFAVRMRTLVANFDLKRYMHVLEGIRKHG
jgi:CheY-like chemotaxis protein